MVDRAGLENRRAARSRGFESHPLRQKSAQRISKFLVWDENAVRAPRSGTDRAMRDLAEAEAVSRSQSHPLRHLTKPARLESVRDAAV